LVLLNDNSQEIEYSHFSNPFCLRNVISDTDIWRWFYSKNTANSDEGLKKGFFVVVLW
jgi:hypothetical protein